MRVLWCVFTLSLGAASPAPRAPQSVSLLSATCEPGSETCGWKVSWRNDGTAFAPSPGDGPAAVQVSNQGEGVGFLERAVELPAGNDLRIVHLSARVRVEGASGRGAGLNLSGLDTGGAMISTNGMGYADYGMVAGTTQWRMIEITAVMPAEVRTIRPGLILYGPGKAIFDRVRLTSRPVTDGHVGKFARAYIGEAAALMRRHSLRRGQADFDAIARDGYRIAGNARTAAEAYPAIRYMLQQIGDGHSFFMSREEKLAWQGGDSAGAAHPPPPMPKGRMIDGFGYISVPGIHSDATDRKTAFAQAIHDAITQGLAAGAAGWIVDLRSNDGGNMFPMLAGLAPFFDRDELGYLVDADGTRDPWGTADRFHQGENAANRVDVVRPATLPPGMPIAVLYGPRTGSSGEIVILSFVGNARTRSFGEPSFGLTTGNGIFPLSDGSELRMASTRMADRSGRIYEGPVVPDVVVKAGTDRSDPVLDEAVAWLKSQH